MTDPIQALKELQPTQEFFIGIDSDGCVFDTMEIKHKECFTPMFIKHFRLQAASKYAREVWDFVNLYSKTRGINRFPALVRALQSAARTRRGPGPRRAVPRRGRSRRGSPAKPKLGNATLKQEVEARQPRAGAGARPGPAAVNGRSRTSSKECRLSRFSARAWPA